MERSISSYEPVSVDEAAAFAARFAADYLSWDEDEPERRAAALRQYLADPRSAVLGWSGTGRQRAELVIPGRTVRFHGTVVVEVTARVVLYERTSPAPTRLRDHRDPGPEPIDDPDWPPMGEPAPLLASGPASAPAPAAPGWGPGAGWWVPLAPPVRRHHDGRLVIDLGLDLSSAR